MSFLPPLDDGETDATLRDVIAMIDAFEGNQGLMRRSRASGRWHIEQLPTTPTKNKLSHGERTRVQLRSLRHEVALLEVVLQRTRSCSQRAQGVDLKPTAKAPRMKVNLLNQMIREHRLRKQAEATNQKLKVLLEKQLQLSSELHAALVKAMTMVEVQVLQHRMVDTQRKRGGLESTRCFDVAI